MPKRVHRKQRNSRRLVCERLEARCVLSTLMGQADVFPVIVAGDPNGVPADSPELRVDNNGNTAFAGVGSLQISARSGTYICTATAMDATHVITAGHCVDLNNDGRSDSRDGIKSITFNVNSDVDAGNDAVDLAIQAASWRTNPSFTGFARPSVNDDLAVITLASALPVSVPTYQLASSDLALGTTLVMVGYGRSGDGVNGYTTGPSFTIKRVGANVVDAFYGQDDGGQAAANEVFRFDFDGPVGNGPLGGATLGNDQETTLGGGDSGGPSFVQVGADATDPASYVLVGVNTFTQGSSTPLFGSMGGGINVFPYKAWIVNGGGGGGGGGGGKGNGGPKAGSAAGVFEASAFVSADIDVPGPAAEIASGIPSAPATTADGLRPAVLLTHSFASTWSPVPLSLGARQAAAHDAILRGYAMDDEPPEQDFQLDFDRLAVDAAACLGRM